MILVDTSAWVEFFRGRAAVGSRVRTLVEDGTAALCGPVTTEIRRGLRKNGREVLRLMEALSFVPFPEDGWTEAGDLGHFLARRGVTAKTLDLIIAVCAIRGSIPLLTVDRDFLAMQRAGVPLALV